jgi:hypothetical protein
MTDASTSLRDDLEAARTAAHALWQRTRTNEQTVWELYRGKNLDHQDAWQAANEIKKKAECAFDQYDRACKTAAEVGR